jgi:CPA1 family monovalent cation:H+ antiporter
MISAGQVVPTLLYVVVGSVLLALVLVRISMAINARISDVSTAVVFQFCSAFGVWILAEQLHLSAIITLVVFAMAASRRAPEILPARMRIPAWAVWEVAVFVLNVLAFILVGFQLKSIAANLGPGTGARYVAVAAAVLLVVILARIVWVTGAAALSRWRCRPRADGQPGPHDLVALAPGSAAVAGWCGMRGTVTLAAALALPERMPFRDLIVVTAFGVVLGTLVLQGLTLRPLLLRLKLQDDGMVEREVRLARVETLRAAVAAAANSPGAGTAELVRHRYELQLRRAEEDLASGTAAASGVPLTETATRRAVVREHERDDDAAVVRAATEAQRRRLVALRTDGTIGDDAFQQVQEALDWAEMDWAQLVR